MSNNNYGFLHMIMFKYKQLTVWGLVNIIKVKQWDLMKFTLACAWEIITNKVNTNEAKQIY